MRKLRRIRRNSRAREVSLGLQGKAVLLVRRVRQAKMVQRDRLAHLALLVRREPVQTCRT